jgi:hypothetical protein
MAQTPTDIKTPVSDFFGYKELGPFIANLVNIAVIVSGILVFLYLVMGGVEWITSGGDKAHVENAQKRITNAIIGLAIVAASWAIWRIVKVFFGLDTALPG